jgi:hypothetical protein
VILSAISQETLSKRLGTTELALGVIPAAEEELGAPLEGDEK